MNAGPSTRDKGHSRATEVADLSEARVLRQGLAAFAELGYQGATVRNLGERLGVSHNFINIRYGSKLNFWKAAVDAATQPLVKDISVAVEADYPSDRERFSAVLGVLYRDAVKSPAINRLLADESARDSERLAYLHERVIGPFWADVGPVVDRLMDAGLMPRVPKEMLFFALTGPALAVTQEPLARLLGRQQDQAPTNSDQYAYQLAGLVLGGVLPSLPGEGRPA